MSPSNVVLLMAAGSVSVTMLVLFTPNKGDTLLMLGIVGACWAARHFARIED